MIPTCTTALERAARYFARRPALRCAEGQYTFEQAWGRGLKLAGALRARGLVATDRIATLEDNRIGAVDTYLGAAAANLVRAPLYPRNSIEAHAHMLTITESKVLFVDEDLASEEVRQLVSKVPSLREVVVRDKGYEAWLEGQTPLEQVAPTALDDLHLIRFSGGTTGLPKAIPLTNRVWMCQLRDITYVLPRFAPGDVCLHMGTLSHGAGYLFIPTWMHGGINQLVVGFEAEKIIDIMEADGIGFTFGAPSMLAALVRARNAKGRDFSRLKGIWIAGAPISPETALLSRTVFGERVYQMFAQTEAAPAVIMPPTEWYATIEGSTPLDAAGRVAPFTELEIRDDDNRPLPVGEVGEIAFRCDGQMAGYLGAPELSAEKVRDGWILSGDVGYLDANGFLYIVDRKGAMIISGGYNIWPAELERVIAKIPGVLEVAVVPVPDERWGETPLAICCIRPGTEVTEQQIVEECRLRLGSYKKPGKVKLQTDPLPKTSVEKINRRALKESYWIGRTKRVAGT